MSRGSHPLSPIDTTVGPQRALPLRDTVQASSNSSVSDATAVLHQPPMRDTAKPIRLDVYDDDDDEENEDSWWSLVAAVQDVFSISLRNDSQDPEADVRGLGEKIGASSRPRSTTRRHRSCLGVRSGGRYRKALVQLVAVAAILR